MKISQEIIEKCKSNIFNYANYPYMIVSIDGDILDCNLSALKQMELENKDDLVGRNLIEFFPEYQADGTLSIVKLKDILSESYEKGFSKFEWQYRDKNGDIVWGEISLTYITIDSEELMFFSWYDIHEKKILEHKYELSKENKVQFLSNISHEIKTPMNAIMGFSELLQKSNISDEQKSYIKAILNNSKELLTLLNDVLDSSKMRVGHLSLHYEIVNLEEFIREIQKIFDLKAKEKELKFNVELLKIGNCNFKLDIKRVSQVLNSLLDNAFKFTKEGFVNLKVEIIKDNNTKVDLLFQVEDSGIGIEKDKLGHIFDVFTQEDASDAREFGGVGLGLSMSSELAKLMGGSLYAESKKGEGSKFTFTLNNIERESSTDKETFNLKGSFESSESENSFEHLQLDSDSMLHLGDFLDSLKTEILVNYEEVVAKQNFDDYELWSRELLLLAKKYKNSVMIDYAQSILDSINSFDIEGLNRLLPQFSLIVENLVKIEKEL